MAAMAAASPSSAASQLLSSGPSWSSLKVGAIALSWKTERGFAIRSADWICVHWVSPSKVVRKSSSRLVVSGLSRIPRDLGVDDRNLRPQSQDVDSLKEWRIPVGSGIGARRTRLEATFLERGDYEIAARDRVLDFGKHKGAMLGMLSSRYLKWMVKNLHVGENSEWAQYAEEVLADPYYKDRLEWEKVEKLMVEAHDLKTVLGHADVLAPAKIYGWDLQDDAGWRKVNFGKIGTTEGGRIPRKNISVPSLVPAPVAHVKKRVVPRKQAVSTRPLSTSLLSPTPSRIADDSSDSLRDELMRRRAKRRDRQSLSREVDNGEHSKSSRDMNPFPGRDSVLSRFRTYDISK